MKLLLDTHAFLWWLEGGRQLSANARSAINDDANDVVVSAATAWEIATKHRLGKLPQAERVAQDVLGAIASQGFEEIDITVDDAQKAGQLPGLHGDPFDRMLIAQAMDATWLSYPRTPNSTATACIACGDDPPDPSIANIRRI